MVLPPRAGLRERILAFGVWGAGKTYAWLQIARYLQEQGSPARFVCVNTDGSVPRMLATEFQDLRNVEVTLAFDWPSLVAWLQGLRDPASPSGWGVTEGDWVVVDLIDTPWEAIQSHYVERVHGQDIGEFFLEAREGVESARKAFEEIGREQMWPFVNKAYFAWANPVLFQVPAHLYATAKTKALSKDDDAGLWRLFPTGIRPSGQKDLGHQFDTVLFFEKPKASEYLVTTFKDRGRRELEAVPVRDFAVQYLLGIAGWRNSA